MGLYALPPIRLGLFMDNGEIMDNVSGAEDQNDAENKNSADNRENAGSPESAEETGSPIVMEPLHSVIRKNARKRRKRAVIREIMEWVRSIVLAIIIAVVIRLFLFEVFLVEGSSMYPTLQNHERLIVNKATYYFHEPEQGDIVVFSYSTQRDFIKRVVAVEGDTVEISDNRLYVNGELMDESYLEAYQVLDFGPVLIPEDHIFVLGDNRGNSMDSRDPSVGYVSLESVKGKAVVVFWPPLDSRLLRWR